MDEYRDSKPLINLHTASGSSSGGNSTRKARNDVQDQLPTDNMRSESAVSPTSYVNLLEDLLLCLQMNVAIAKGFDGLELPTNDKNGKKLYIDLCMLWPILPLSFSCSRFFLTLFLFFYIQGPYVRGKKPSNYYPESSNFFQKCQPRFKMMRMEMCSPLTSTRIRSSSSWGVF